jgi:DNA-directed RNA polymerase specialized sigma24 family protein
MLVTNLLEELSFVIVIVNLPLYKRYGGRKLRFALCTAAEDLCSIFLLRGWLDRENFRGLQPGTTWFLVAMDWWKRWKEFIGRQKSVKLNFINNLIF